MGFLIIVHCAYRNYFLLKDLPSPLLNKRNCNEILVELSVMFIGEKDPDVVKKTNMLRVEVWQVQVQLADVPVEMVTEMSEKELTDYFNSNKVNKKYRLKKK